MTKIKNVSIKVKGRVQGVGYRYNTMVKARELGIKGYVKNERDGSVYMEAEAEDRIMETFIDWVKQGPEWARVDNASIQIIPHQGFEGFQIK